MLLAGRHCVPSRKSKTPIFAIAGTPPANRNRHMSTTAAMDTQAVSRKTALIAGSFSFFIKNSLRGESRKLSPR